MERICTFYFSIVLNLPEQNKEKMFTIQQIRYCEQYQMQGLISEKQCSEQDGGFEAPLGLIQPSGKCVWSRDPQKK